MTNLHRIRKQRNLSLRDVGDQLGCTHVAILNYEKGRRPLPLYARALEALFGHPIHVLLSDDESLIGKGDV